MVSVSDYVMHSRVILYAVGERCKVWLVKKKGHMIRIVKLLFFATHVAVRLVIIAKKKYSLYASHY